MQKYFRALLTLLFEVYDVIQNFKNFTFDTLSERHHSKGNQLTEKLSHVVAKKFFLKQSHNAKINSRETF